MKHTPLAAAGPAPTTLEEVDPWMSRYMAAVDESRAEALRVERLHQAAPDLLAEIERQYIELADYRNHWAGRDSSEGQAKLCRLRDLIAKATGRSEMDVQDDYGTRAARDAAAKATGGTE